MKLFAKIFGLLVASSSIVLGAPVVLSTSVTTNLVAPGGMKFNAIVNPSSIDTLVWFQYGGTTNYGSVTSVTDIGSGSGNITVSLTITNLNPSGIYNVQVVASNTFSGVTVKGQNTVTTNPPLAVVTYNGLYYTLLNSGIFSPTPTGFPIIIGGGGPGTNGYNFINGTNIFITQSGSNVTINQALYPVLTASTNIHIVTNSPANWTVDATNSGGGSTTTNTITQGPGIKVTVTTTSPGVTNWDIATLLSNTAPVTLVTNMANGAVIIGSSFPTNANWINIKTFGALGGTHDDTVAFQNAAYFCATNQAVIYIDPATNYTISNIQFTNNTAFYGFNSLVQQLSTANGPMITIAPAQTNVLLYGIIMDGGQVGFNSSSVAGTSPWFEDSNTNIVRSLFGSVRERSGVTFFNLQTNSQILYCTARGFADRGFIVDGAGGSFVQPQNQVGTIFSHNIALNNWIGLNYTNGAEYITSIDWHASQNGYGAAVDSGNDYITDGEMTRNGIALYVRSGGGANPAHGSIANFSLNHNIYSMAFCNSANGFEACNLHIAGDLSMITITNFTGAHIDGGQILPTLVIVDAGGNTTMGFNHIISSYFDTSISPIVGGAASFFKVDACFNGTQNTGLPYLSMGSYIRYAPVATNTLRWVDADGLDKALTIGANLSISGTTLNASGGGVSGSSNSVSSGLNIVLTTNTISTGVTNYVVATSNNLVATNLTAFTSVNTATITASNGVIQNFAGSYTASSAITSHDNTTNFWPNLGIGIHQTCVLANNFCISLVTNGPGSSILDLFSNGANRIFTFPQAFNVVGCPGVTPNGTNFQFIIPSGFNARVWLDSGANNGGANGITMSAKVFQIIPSLYTLDVTNITGGIASVMLVTNVTGNVFYGTLNCLLTIRSGSTGNVSVGIAYTNNVTPSLATLLAPTSTTITGLQPTIVPYYLNISNTTSLTLVTTNTGAATYDLHAIFIPDSR